MSVSLLKPIFVQPNDGDQLVDSIRIFREYAIIVTLNLSVSSRWPLRASNLAMITLIRALKDTRVFEVMTTCVGAQEQISDLHPKVSLGSLSVVDVLDASLMLEFVQKAPSLVVLLLVSLERPAF